MTRSTSSGQAWTPEPRSFAAWSVERTGSTQRITEQAILRVTEQGNIRIIERPTFKWTIPLKSPDPWHLS